MNFTKKEKTKKNTRNKMTKVVQSVIVGSMAVSAFLTANPIKTEAHSAYFVSTTINPTQLQYVPVVLYDKNEMDYDSHKEASLGVLQDYSSKTAIPLVEKLEDSKEEWEDMVGDGEWDLGDPPLKYTFPSIHTRGILKGEMNATLQDSQKAQNVADNLVQGLNEAIGFMYVNSKDGDNRKVYSNKQFLNIGAKIANAGRNAKNNGSAKVNVMGSDFTLEEKAPKSLANGTSKGNYIKITASNKQSTYVVENIRKGYVSTNGKLDGFVETEEEKNGKVAYMAEDVPTELREQMVEDVEFLTWRDMVFQGNYVYLVKSATFSEIQVVAKPGKVEKILTEIGNSMIDGVRQLIGLYDIKDLMLNEGKRGTSEYYEGIMPKAWMTSSMVLHFISMTLAGVLILSAIVKLLVSRNLSAMSPSMRVDVWDGLKNIIIVGFALMMFNPIFYALVHFNSLLVDIFASSTSLTTNFGSASGQNYLAGIIISLAYLIMEVYFNFIYISRGVIVALLYGVGPLFVVSLAFGGKYRQIFSTYSKELVGTIYMQTFHAALVAFFVSVSFVGGMRVIEQLVLLFCFIPLTKFFREALGVGGGITDVAGAGAFGAVGSLAKGGRQAVSKGAKGRFNAIKESRGSGGSKTAGTSQMPKKSIGDFNTSQASASANAQRIPQAGAGASVGGASTGINGAPTSSFNAFNKPQNANSMFNVAEVNDKKGNTKQVSLEEMAENARKNNDIRKKMGLDPSTVPTMEQEASTGVSDVLKGGMAVAKGMVSAGSNLGLEAVGQGKLIDKKGQPKKANAKKQQQQELAKKKEGLMYESLSEDGNVSYTHGKQELLAGTGTTGFKDYGKDSDTFDATYDYDASKKKFTNPAFEGSAEEEELGNMVEAFKNRPSKPKKPEEPVLEENANEEQLASYNTSMKKFNADTKKYEAQYAQYQEKKQAYNERTKPYRDKGVKNVRVNEHNQPVVSYNKNKMGVKEISQSGSSVIMKKDVNSPVDNQFLSRVTEKPKQEAPKPQGPDNGQA